jgi:hypothetical protein
LITFAIVQHIQYRNVLIVVTHNDSEVSDL